MVRFARTLAQEPKPALRKWHCVCSQVMEGDHLIGMVARMVERSSPRARLFSQVRETGARRGGPVALPGSDRPCAGVSRAGDPRQACLHALWWCGMLDVRWCCRNSFYSSFLRSPFIFLTAPGAAVFTVSVMFPLFQLIYYIFPFQDPFRVHRVSHCLVLFVYVSYLCSHLPPWSGVSSSHSGAHRVHSSWEWLVLL